MSIFAITAPAIIPKDHVICVEIKSPRISRMCRGIFHRGARRSFMIRTCIFKILLARKMSARFFPPLRPIKLRGFTDFGQGGKELRRSIVQRMKHYVSLGSSVTVVFCSGVAFVCIFVHVVFKERSSRCHRGWEDRVPRDQKI
jgi:hypothetical protein